MWNEVVLFACIGFVAQVIDGALGMAYGVTAAMMLLGLGVAPSVASASVHAAEVFTAGVSGSAHWCLGNIEPALVRRLALAGIVGGATGAYVLTTLPGSFVRPFVGMYLLGMGLVIMWRAIGRLSSDRWTSASSPKQRRVIPVGTVVTLRLGHISTDRNLDEVEPTWLMRRLVLQVVQLSATRSQAVGRRSVPRPPTDARTP